MDNDPSPGLANLIVPFRRSKIEVAGANIYDLRPDDIGTFDIVISCGLIYHLRYPMLAVKVLANLVKEGGLLIIETGILQHFEDFPVLFFPFGTDSPYEQTSPTFFNLSCLGNAYRQASFSGAEVLHEFDQLQFDPRDKFPKFGRTFPDELMTITRTIVCGRKMVSQLPGVVEDYFEGRHRLHTRELPVELVTTPATEHARAKSIGHTDDND